MDNRDNFVAKEMEDNLFFALNKKLKKTIRRRLPKQRNTNLNNKRLELMTANIP